MLSVYFIILQVLQHPSLDRSCRTPLCLDSSLQRAGIGPAVVQQQLLDSKPGQGHSSRLQTAVSGNCSPDILSSPVRSIMGWGEGSGKGYQETQTRSWQIIFCREKMILLNSVTCLSL